MPPVRPDRCDPTAALPCWLEVDLDAVAKNVAALKRWVGPRTQLAAVLKAQGYGAGAPEVGRACLAAGAAWLAVARLHEALELRQSDIEAPILVMNRTDPAEADAAVEHDLAVTVDTVELGRALGAAAVRLGRRAVVHVKVDTGMHRFGVEMERALPLVRELARIEGLELQGLWTHFANADEPDQTFTRQQLDRFDLVTQTLEAEGYRFPIRHAANSAATLGCSAAHFQMVRVGLALFGFSPAIEVPAGLDLRSAVSFRTRVARLMDLARGDGVGYGQTWQADRRTRLALVNAGYADGLLRQLGNRGAALVRGREAPIIGRVSMDQTTLDVTTVPGANVGDVVTLFGRDGSAEIDLHRYAAAADTIAHDALTAVGGRVARVYRRNGSAEQIQRLGGALEV